ncbi:MAG: Pyruvate kinase [Candidatus Magasanikbacteria bacterium GW2011_GWC2_34_16]|uniref:Pyruvate kinase n=2 Tax=Candidatus Magasanikiibacteriota TaxID=1752731 RepID=A0A0G0HLQ8_9BACT|nr:MAG: Pyruvate kinase [Candidatus Magasanikbacteria bacterium GW2011_GWC2_34_16]KKQ39505.1 MAG: Pyruvate kinase [Candidatus Magasanikbacteria bacterium GW2011_GWA2_37_8]
MILIASVGPATIKENYLQKIIVSGPDILRYNLSNDTPENNIENLKTITSAIEDNNSSIKLMVDFPSWRSTFGDFIPRAFAVHEGDSFVFQSATSSPDCNQFIPVDVPKVGTNVQLEKIIPVYNGEVAIHVTEIIDENSFRATFLNSGFIHSHRSIDISTELDETTFLEFYRQLTQTVSSASPQLVSLPQMEKTTLEKVLTIFAEFNWYPKIVSKVDKFLTPEELTKLCQENFYRFLILDRGKLGINMPYQKLGIYQKAVIKKAKENDKTILVGSQILESVIKNNIPARSDINDLTNILMDGADGIVLCGETSNTTRPIYAIAVAKKIITAVKNYQLLKQI